MQEIADWLDKLGMSEYAQRFAENRIDLSVLPDLTDQDLEKHRGRTRRSAENPARYRRARRMVAVSCSCRTTGLRPRLAVCLAMPPPSVDRSP